MFQMKDVGRKIANRRKEKNMTQMELADLMGVSFQAVSNWERGNSMPDIAKLPELAEWLDISIDELLTDDAPAKLVQHILSGDEQAYIKEKTVQPDTVADVAPILKPQQTESLMDTVLESNVESVNVSDLTPIAPFVSDTFLHSWVMKIANVDNIKDLSGLAPFLSDETLDLLVDKVTESNFSLRALTPLAPFLPNASLDKLAKRALIDTELHDLTSLAPFLSKETLDFVVKEATAREKPNLRALVPLAPFLSKETLNAVAERALETAGENDLVALAPFLARETLQNCTSKLFENMDLKMIKKLAPFL